MSELSRNERLKEASAYLRGTLAEGLTQTETGAITEDDQQLVKFHGMYLQLDRIAREYANHTLRLTTRQTFQYHGVIKSNLKRTMQAINAALLDTLAACGDVNRNVLAASNPHRSQAHAAAYELAKSISDHLLPKTPAYREIWLD